MKRSRPIASRRLAPGLLLSLVLSLVLSLSLAVTLGASRALAAPGDPGCEFDFDGDGLVTEDDLWFCQSLLQIFPPIYNPLCDTNGDGSLTTLDLFPIVEAVASGVDCRAVVPIGSPLSRGLLLAALSLASLLALRFGVERSARGGDVP